MILPKIKTMLSAPPNPIFLKETRSQMRGLRAFIIISIYLTLVGGLVGLVYATFTGTMNASSVASISQGLGKAIFASVVGLNLMMVCFLAPGLTAGAIAAERERQTYDLLRTTLLSARHLVDGKTASAVSFLLILLAAGFPIQAMAYWFGGVSVEEVLVSSLMLVVCAITFCALGVFISSLFHSTLVSTVVSYILTTLLLFGLPVLLGFAASFLGMLGSMSNLSDGQELIIEILLYSVGYLLVCVNPLTAGIFSEVMLLDQQQIFYTTLPLTNGWQFPVLSPWIAFSAFYLILSLILLRIATASINNWRGT